MAYAPACMPGGSVNRIAAAPCTNATASLCLMLRVLLQTVPGTDQASEGPAGEAMAEAMTLGCCAVLMLAPEPLRGQLMQGKMQKWEQEQVVSNQNSSSFG